DSSAVRARCCAQRDGRSQSALLRTIQSGAVGDWSMGGCIVFVAESKRRRVAQRAGLSDDRIANYSMVVRVNRLRQELIRCAGQRRIGSEPDCAEMRARSY